MSPSTIGLIGLGLLFVFLAFRMPIGIAMGLVGLLGLVYLRGWSQGLNMVSMVPYRTAAAYTLSTIPLFVLMGNFAFYSGISTELYSAARKWLGSLPGGLALATMAGCAGFAAVSGSSVANAITMGTVCLPEMRKYSYHPSMSTGVVAAGGTLGILIPPSIGFIFYSILTTESISKLFIAGFIPGILLTLIFMATTYLGVRADPTVGPRGPSTTFMEKVKSLKDTWPILILFFVVIGGMYLGVFTPTEGAGVGAFVALVLLLAKKGFNTQLLRNSLLDTGKMAAMCFIIVTGAYIFSYFITFTQVPQTLAMTVLNLQVDKYIIFALVVVIYLFLGCVMDTIAMIILTVPIFYPVMIALGFDPIWFGVVIVLTMEMGLITPPVGMNVFVISGVSKVPLENIFRGVAPYLGAMVVFIIVMTIFPQIVLFLPTTMK